MAQKKGKKVAIIEDDEVLAGLYVERFSQEGYDVILATDGEKAIEIIQSHNPDLIILDIMLPKKNGIEVLQIVKNQPSTSSIPVIVLSALNEGEYADRVNNFGAVGFFNKAITIPGEITCLVNKMLFPEL